MINTSYPKNLKRRIIHFYETNETRLEIAFFVAGFIWDIVMMDNIDNLFSLTQQMVYLFIIATILHYEVLFRLHKWKPSKKFISKVWNYRSLILHFLLGSLLSLYSLLYIKSSSFLSSLIFLLFMIVLLVANELPFLKNAKVSVKVGLFAICLFSFFSIIFPLIFGFVGWLPFGFSISTTVAFFYLQIKFLRKKISEDKILFQVIALPGLAIVCIFSLFYSLGWIPPVPISAKDQGIYHAVEKENGKYLLTTEKVWWKFWQSGDQYFKAREGDKIYYYVQIYSPTRFSDQVYIRWLFYDPKLGWQKTDRIPLQITGGRDAGFRASTYKSNYQPGDWRVVVETSMEHEITRLNFTVVNDEGIEPRNFYKELR
jgi:hypothetical protein